MNSHPELDTIPAIERVTHRIGVWVEHAVPGTPLTQAEAHILAHLARHSPCSINDLHHGFGHRRSTLTSVLDRLEARGWVRRGPHPLSRRLVLVTLTNAGRAVAGEISAALRHLDDRVRAHVRAGDIAAWQRVLSALEEALSHDP